MKTALVSCCFECGNLSFPLGTLCIESAILQSPVLSDCQTRHFSFITGSDDPAVAAARVSQWEPDVVGLSVYLWNRNWFDRFTEELRKTCSPVLFAGGPEVTANAYSFDLDQFTFLCVGEGEESTVRALEQIRQGLGRQDNLQPQGNGIITRQHPEFSYAFPADLEKLPSVLLSGVADVFLEKETTVLWEMTRGCPFGCHFCFESKGLRSVRHFDFARLEKELDVLIRFKVKDVFVLDPTFNTDRSLTQKILKLLVEKAPKWMHFSFEVRAELLDQKLVDLFSQLFCSLQIGLQSTDPKVLKAINRTFNEEVFSRKIEMLNKRGVVFGLDLIIGLPYDSFDVFCRSLDFAVSCQPSNIDIFRLAVLPGTALHDNAKALGLDYQETAPYLIESSESFPGRDLKLAGRLKEACDLFYTKGEACMWMHSLCEAADLTPTEVFEHFWSFCPDCGTMEYEGDGLYKLQDDFVRSLLSHRRQLLPALLSYIEFHQALSFLYETGDSPVAQLWYDPNTLSTLDDLDIRDFVRQNRPFAHPQNYQLYLDGDGNLMFND